MGIQALNAVLGIWLMAAPAVLGYGGSAALNDRVCGPLAAGFALIAVHEVTRPLRWLILPVGIWLLAAPWVLGYETAAAANSVVVGLLLCLLAPRGGLVRYDFGGGWTSLPELAARR